MDLGIWSKLPENCVALVIEQADSIDIEQWCEATKHCSYLYAVAVRRRWSEVAIDELDLLPKPGEDAISREQNIRYGRRRKIPPPPRRVSESRLPGLIERNIQGIIPAHYIRELSLNFLFRAWRDPKYEYTDYDLYHCPSFESLEYSMSLLIPQLKKVKKIRVDGAVDNEVLSWIIKIDPNNIDTLKLREQRPERSALFWKNHSMEGMLAKPSVRLDFELLRRLPNLRSLEIRRLLPTEISQFAKMLPTLRNLEKLVLASKDWNDEESESIGGMTPLSSLIQEMISSSVKPDGEDHAVLFQSLRALTMVNGHVGFHDVQFSSEPARIPRPLCLNLSEINLDVGYSAASALLSFFDPQALQRLALPSRVALNVAGEPVHKGFPLDNQILPEINAHIEKHKTSLEEIKLLRAWDSQPSLPENLNNVWIGQFSVQELVLGTKHPTFYLTRPASVETVQNDIAHEFCHPLTPMEHHGRWGATLKRLRIDHLCPTRITPFGLAQSCLAHVKILMLAALSAPRPVARVARHYRSSPSDDGEDFSSDFSTPNIVHVAESIAAMPELESLTVLVIDTKWFWIPSPSTDSQAQKLNIDSPSPMPRRIPWFWHHAKVDAHQAAEMSRRISKRDWAFLRDESVPRLDQREHREWWAQTSRIRKGLEVPELVTNLGKNRVTPDPVMFSEWNYMVMLPEGAD